MTPSDKSDKSDDREKASVAHQSQESRRRDPELRACFDRILALRSAWSTLAPSGLCPAAEQIVEKGRMLSTELKAAASRGSAGRDAAVIPRLDSLLDEFESEMRASACELSGSELRAALGGPGTLDRPAVLALLDLMLGNAVDGLDSAALHIPSIDCVITLLCVGVPDDAEAAAEAAVLDPVRLTPRLRSLCAAADALENPVLSDLEAAFIAAAAETEHNPVSEASLFEQKKIELGASYFAPSLLRAIVNYNAAVFRRVHSEPGDGQDVEEIPDPLGEADANGSVFETTVLPLLVEALQRRAAGGLPTFAAIDAVATGLDLAYLNGAEQAALLSPLVGHVENIKGTVVLVGLLCRAAAELETELPLIGISPEQLSAQWIHELDSKLKEQIQHEIANDDYPEACALSELKSKFLYRSILELSVKKERPVVTPERASDEGSAEQAKRLTEKAIEEKTAPADARRRPSPPGSRRKLLTQVATLAAGTAALALLALFALPTSDLSHFSRAELDGVSQHLASGSRNGLGKGSAFVGTLEDDWAGLAEPEREEAATRLVETLRAQGIREIMVYDDQRRLRIQALGERPVRIVASVP